MKDKQARASAFTSAFKSETKTLSRPRRLLLCLDGVPYDVIQAARGRGLFDGFGDVTRLLSPFPTMTNIALSTMLHASAPLGYESLYFDCCARELRGGVRKYIGRRTPDKIPSSYMDELDYQEPLPFEFLVYVAPEAVWRADFRRFRERFRKAPQDRDFFAFLKGTDGLLHIRGPARLHKALESLDRILREIIEWCGRETEIVLFSDHGMNLQENRRINLQTHLRRHGFQVTDRFDGQDQLQGSARRRVAIPAFGLCGYAALYCADESITRAATDALTELEGVDFAIHRDGANAIVVKGARGAARIHRAENNFESSIPITHDGDSDRRGQSSCAATTAARYRYEQLEGDPLQLAGIARQLSEEKLFDEQGYACEEAWYARTANHIYPDALANLFAALHSRRVRHTADVLLSLDDGYYYGDSLFSRLARLAATHGNALRASTSAFMMSTHREFSPVVRAHDAHPLLRA